MQPANVERHVPVLELDHERAGMKPGVGKAFRVHPDPRTLVVIVLGWRGDRPEQGRGPRLLALSEPADPDGDQVIAVAHDPNGYLGTRPCVERSSDSIYVDGIAAHASPGAVGSAGSRSRLSETAFSATMTLGHDMEMAPTSGRRLSRSCTEICAGSKVTVAVCAAALHSTATTPRPAAQHGLDDGALAGSEHATDMHDRRIGCALGDAHGKAVWT